VPGDQPPPAWVALRIAVPDAAVRASTWRALREMGALNVQRGLWAVHDDPDHRRRLTDLAAHADAAGGRAAVEPVDPAGADGVVLGSRLHRACERLWEPLANEADLYQARVARGGWSMDERVAALTALVSRFAATIGLDIVRSQGAHLAEARLVRLAADLVAAVGDDPDRWCRRRPQGRRRVEPVASYPLADGTRAFVAEVRTTPDPLWEAAFARFEAYAYRPSRTRLPLAQGTFRWCAENGAEDELLAAAARRIEQFEASIR
jgi:hypothetical protein